MPATGGNRARDHETRHRRVGADVVARRRHDLLHRGRRHFGRRTRPRSAQRRRLCVRREQQAPAALEHLGRHGRRKAADRRQLSASRRTASRATAGPSSSNARPRRSSTTAHKGEVWMMDAGRRQRAAADAQQRRGIAAGAVARRLADSVSRRHQREVRAVLQPESVRDARVRGHAEAGHSRFSVRGRSGELGARRQVDSRRRQHGRPRARSSRSTSRRGARSS